MLDWVDCCAYGLARLGQNAATDRVLRFRDLVIPATSCSRRTKCIVEILPQVVDMLDTDAESEQRRGQMPLPRDRSPALHC